MTTQQRTVRTAANLSIRAEFDLSTLDTEKRTVEVVFGSDAPVLMGYYSRYYEILSFKKGHVRWERLNSGAPLLDNHNRWESVTEQPGVVEKAWTTDNKKGRALIRFSKNERGTKMMEQVEDKIVRNVSFGYVVHKYEEVESAGEQSDGRAENNKIPTYRAIDWEGSEISFVNIPADITAGVRSGERGQEQPEAVEIPIQSLNSSNMFRKRQFDAGGPGEGNGGGGSQPQGGEQNRGQNGGGTGQPNNEDGGEQNRGQNAGAAQPNSQNNGGQPANGGEQNRGQNAGAAQPDNQNSGAQPANGGEQNRGQNGGEQAPTEDYATQSIRAFEAAGITDLRDMSDMTTKAKGDINKLRALILENMSNRTNGNGQHSANRHANAGGNNNADAYRQAVGDAILHRAAPELLKDGKLPDGAREFRSMSLLEIARHSAERSGISTYGMSKREIAEAAMGLSRMGGAMSTSDFPIILGNTVNRVLQARYEEIGNTWMPLSRRKNASDFKLMTMTRMSGAGKMEEIKEGGEYTRASMDEVGDTHRVKKFGKIIPITWETIINDDLGAFGDLPSIIAQMARTTQDDIVWALILGGSGNNGSVMYDGNQLFDSSNHGNIDTGATISINSMGTMRKLMRKQKGLKDNERLNLKPEYLIVGPELEQLALQYTSANYTPDNQGDINPWKGLKPIVEARFEDYDANSWLLAAANANVPTLIHSFLEGESELFTEQRVGFDVDGIEVKARMVFGAKVTDWRGWAKNPGVS